MTGPAVPIEAVDAAARAFYGTGNPPSTWYEGMSDATRSHYRQAAEAALAAALPAVRRQIANEILAELIAAPQRYIGSTTAALGYVDGLKVAEQLARGGDGMTGDPRVQVDSYVVYPTGYEQLVHSDKYMWCLSVVNGHAYGWSIRRGIGMHGSAAMNRKGEWVYEDRGSGRNKPRRFPVDEALRVALEHVDTHRINGCTATEASTDVARRMEVRRG